MLRLRPVDLAIDRLDQVGGGLEAYGTGCTESFAFAELGTELAWALRQVVERSNQRSYVSLTPVRI